MRYIIFGTGEYYKRYKRWFRDLDVVALLDNDPQKQGSIIDGRKIITPSHISEYEYDAIVILSFYAKEMKTQLIGLGVPEDKIYHFFDLHELFMKEKNAKNDHMTNDKSILLLSHDLLLGGPALALYHAALALKKDGYEVVFGSMLDGELKTMLEDSFIPVIVDRRLQINTMRELPWTGKFDLIICNTINYHVFLSDRDCSIPIIWWLHDARRYYDGIKEDRLKDINTSNMKILSVGPIPAKAFNEFLPDIHLDSLLYGVSENE